MDIEEDHDASYLHQDASPNGERMSGGVAGEILSLLTRMELDSAYISEKLLNLEILLMQVESRENDCEGLILQNGDSSVESLEKALEFDALSGILNSEVKELDSFMVSLRVEIGDARHRLTMDDQCDEIGEKLHDAEENLKQSQHQLADMRMWSAQFEKTVTFGIGGHEETENGDFVPQNANWKLQNVEHQRHILQSYEKSLARELDLEKKLSDSRCLEEDLKLKLQFAERERYIVEESMEIDLKKLFEAENAAELLLGISKDLSGKLQIVQFNLNGSIRQESDMRSKLQEAMLKLSSEESASENLKRIAADVDNVNLLQDNGLQCSIEEVEGKSILASSEALSLKEKVFSLEERLKEADVQLQQAKASAEASDQQQNILRSELNEMEHAVEAVKADVMKAEIRANNAEAQCTLLVNTNTELNEELGFFRNNGAEKAMLLEKKLKESDTQLEHAKASVEAVEEQQTMLYSTLDDMENLIEDLKTKVLKAENRAENAESKCALLTETNLELNEEVGFLRSRLECLETSLRQAKDAKTVTANDIGIKTKVIGELVMKLAQERELLQLKMSALMKMNKILEEKCLIPKDKVAVTVSNKEFDDSNENSVLKSSEETLTEPSTAKSQVEKSAAPKSSFETVEEISVCAEDTFDTAPKFETVRMIDVMQLNTKWLFIAILVFLVSLTVMYLLKIYKI